jgi:hypothetical protein
MGLDQYLLAEQRFEAGTVKHQLITDVLSAENHQNLKDVDYDYSTYVSGWDFSRDAAFQPLVALTQMEPDRGSPHFTVTMDGPAYLVRACAVYWRKANAVHEWFVREIQDGVDECQISRPVHPEELADLLSRCRQVLETPLLAAQLLPSVSGFFFGSTDYDEWYISDLEMTVRRLLEVYETYPKPLVLRYQSSW